MMLYANTVALRLLDVTLLTQGDLNPTRGVNEDFAYRIDIQWWVFAVAGMVYRTLTSDKPKVSGDG